MTASEGSSGPGTVTDLFVSFNKADRDFALRLVKRVESETIDRRHMKCFISEWDIQPGENILLKIEEALPHSRFTALVMSPEWVKSDWTTLERVISVYEDPAGIKGRIIPILRRNCDIPPSIRILKWIDFTSNSAFDKQCKILAARIRGIPIRATLPKANEALCIGQPSSEAFRSFEQSETLASNLFQVIQLPSLIHSIPSRVAKRDEIWPIVGEGAQIPPFSLREEEGRIYSFSALREVPSEFAQLIDEEQHQRIPTISLLNSRSSRAVIEILNRAMTAHMRDLGMTYDWNTKKTFFPIRKPEDEVRYYTWKGGKRISRRIVAMKSKSGMYYAHRYCKATFQTIGSNLFLRLVPGWHFTTDGMSIPVAQNNMTSLSTRWMNMERNHAVLDDVRFWVYVLAGGSSTITFDVGSTVKAKVTSTPLVATIDQGIEGDYRERLWIEEEPAKDEAAETADAKILAHKEDEEI